MVRAATIRLDRRRVKKSQLKGSPAWAKDEPNQKKPDWNRVRTVRLVGNNPLLRAKAMANRPWPIERRHYESPSQLSASAIGVGSTIGTIAAERGIGGDTHAGHSIGPSPPIAFPERFADDLIPTPAVPSTSAHRCANRFIAILLANPRAIIDGHLI
jgi:hypothetical protein